MQAHICSKLNLLSTLLLVVVCNRDQRLAYSQYRLCSSNAAHAMWSLWCKMYMHAVTLAIYLINPYIMLGIVSALLLVVSFWITQLVYTYSIVWNARYHALYYLNIVTSNHDNYSHTIDSAIALTIPSIYGLIKYIARVTACMYILHHNDHMAWAALLEHSLYWEYASLWSRVHAWLYVHIDN